MLSEMTMTQASLDLGMGIPATVSIHPSLFLHRKILCMLEGDPSTF